LLEPPDVEARAERLRQLDRADTPQPRQTVGGASHIRSTRGTDGDERKLEPHIGFIGPVREPGVAKPIAFWEWALRMRSEEPVAPGSPEGVSGGRGCLLTDSGVELEHAASPVD
jgi:hypothetical protein